MLELQPPDVRVGHPPSTTPSFFPMKSRVGNYFDEYSDKSSIGAAFGDYVTTRKYGIISRLGNLIVVQVLFIFAALALILFVPERNPDMDRRLSSLQRELIEIGRLTTKAVESSEYISEAGVDRPPTLNELLDTMSHIAHAAIVRVGDDNRLEIRYAYSRPEAGSAEVPDTQDISAFSSYPTLRLMALTDSDVTSQTALASDYLVYYHRLSDSEAGQPVVLVLAMEHGFTVSSQSHLQYVVLILFLCSTLVSLLTVWLLTKKFKLPLDRIIAGFEETADGKLHNLTELVNDPHLGKLTCAYNAMTRKLWDNRKELDDYCTRLGHANVELQESRSFLMTLFDSTPLSVVVTDSQGAILMMNKTAAEVFGYQADELAGQPLSRLLDEDSGQIVSEATDGNQRSFEAICRRQDGEEFPGYLISSQFAREGDRSGVRLYVCRDISDSKNFQEMMIRLDRYYSRGEMAGDIAHEINNYLAVLLGNVELLPRYLKKGDMEKVEKKLEVMKVALESIARFSDGLLDSGVDTVRLEPVPINQIVENVFVFLGPQNKFDAVELVKELSDEVPVLRVDLGQIQQMLVNLIYNAAEAVADNEGQKSIEVATAPSEINGKPGVKITVRDNGPGVAADKEELLFNTRFTTKERGHGIGLVTCRRIADNHCGEITYEAQQGAVFSVFLPVAQESVELADASRASAGQLA